MARVLCLRKDYPMRKLGLTAVLLAVLAASLAALPATATHATTNGLIAFNANVQGTSQVFTIRPDGTGLTQLTHGKPGAGQYGVTWSPDGTSVLYQVPGRSFDILYKADADGSGATHWSPPCTHRCLGDDYPAYSPSGGQVAFERAFGPVKNNTAAVDAIFTTNAQAGALTQLTQKKTPTSTEDHRPAWSPNGKQIVFQRLNTLASPRNLGAIYVMNANGSAPRKLTALAMDAGSPYWSPDSKTIVFNSYQDGSPTGKDANIYTIRPDGTGLKQLTHYSGGHLQALAKDFSPDGTKIVFHLRGPNESGPGFNQLFTMNADGNAIHQLTHLSPRSNPGGGSASWGTAS